MLDQVQKPTRYTGGEMNTQLKPWDSAKLHFAFCFPDTYEVGMSHLGMKILYAAMNQQPDMLCERAFMPVGGHDGPDEAGESPAVHARKPQPAQRL